MKRCELSMATGGPRVTVVILMRFTVLAFRGARGLVSFLETRGLVGGIMEAVGTCYRCLGSLAAS